MTIHGYDLVGDIHGHADALHRQLPALDYAEIEGVFRQWTAKSNSVSYAIPVCPNRGNATQGRPSIPLFPRIRRRALDA
jgi:hypothetical protein